jgi:hypothetical protein
MKAEAQKLRMKIPYSDSDKISSWAADRCPEGEGPGAYDR